MGPEVTLPTAAGVLGPIGGPVQSEVLVGVPVGECHVGCGSGDRLLAAVSVETWASGVCPGLHSVLRDVSSFTLFCHCPGMTPGVSKQMQGHRDTVRGQVFTAQVREQTQLGHPHHTPPHPIPEDWSPAPRGWDPGPPPPGPRPTAPPQVLAGFRAPEGHVRRVGGDLIDNQDWH